MWTQTIPFSGMRMFRVLGTVTTGFALGDWRALKIKQTSTGPNPWTFALVGLFGRTNQIVRYVEPGGCDLTRPQATAFTSKGDGTPKLSNFPQEMCSATAQGGILFIPFHQDFWRGAFCFAIWPYISAAHLVYHDVLAELLSTESWGARL